MKVITTTILNNLFHFLRDTEDFVFLDTSKPDPLNKRSMLFLNPVDRIQHYCGEDEVRFLENIQKVQERGLCLAGWFAYEFGYLLEPALKELLQKDTDKGALLADLAVYESYHTFDHQSGVSDFPQRILTDDGQRQDAEPAPYTVSNIRPSCSKDQYVGALKKIIQYIEAGDTYQVNYTFKLLFDFQGETDQLYTALRRNQSVGYGAYIRWGNQRILSFSPELFFWRNSAEVKVRPMKGTVQRGKTLTEDVLNGQYLQTDIKNQSENVMIVDLLRNDLGRLMHQIGGGRVEVESLFDVETYETLLQMTSTITGKANGTALERLSLHDFVKAIYPCGSVTGAPKIRTMEIIDELETHRRGVYTGAIGCLLPSGESVFNVPIRTVTLHGSVGEMGIGSGIVHDSDPHLEWQECLLKGCFLTESQKEFKLIETLLWLPQQGYFLLEKHLQRLQNSASYFLFYCDVRKISEELLLLSDCFGNYPQRLRLLLEKDGQYSIETTRCNLLERKALFTQAAAGNDSLPKIALHGNYTDSNSLWVYHKTTNRELYSGAYANAVADGYADVIFRNEKGCVTEGCISNLFIYKDGKYLTPPLSDGLLAGVMREHLLEVYRGEVQEESLTIADLVGAEMIFICNSIRGVTQVEIDL